MIKRFCIGMLFRKNDIEEAQKKLLNVPCLGPICYEQQLIVCTARTAPLHQAFHRIITWLPATPASSMVVSKWSLRLMEG